MSEKGGDAISKNRIKPVLKWHVDGGKHYLASRIVALMPAHTHYCEPYFGGGSVLLAKNPDGVSEVVNDLNRNLANFWSVLRDPDTFEQFRRFAEATPFSELEFAGSCEWLTRYGDAEGLQVPRAFNFFVRCRQSLAGRMTSFTGVTKTRTRRGMNNEVSAWLSAVDGLPAVHARLRRVLILNRPALDVMRGQDGPQTLFYLDPPYLHQTRASTGEYGAHEMTEDQHTDLCTVIRGCKGKVMLSGYPSDLYKFQLEAEGWNRHDFSIANHAAGGAVKRKMVESVWTNF